MLFLYRFLVNIPIADMIWTEIKKILDFADMVWTEIKKILDFN